MYLSEIPPIGPSTGWLSALIDPSLRVHAEVIKNSGATAAEVVLGNSEREDAFIGTSLRDFVNLEYLSVHLADLRIPDPGKRITAEQSGNYWRHAMQVNRVDAATIHPDRINFRGYQLLNQARVPYALENLDCSTHLGQTADDMEVNCLWHDRPLVLDLQHAYEVSIKLGKHPDFICDRILELSDRFQISHVHVSGQTEIDGQLFSNHALLKDSSNSGDIIRSLRNVILKLGGCPPIIIEGNYLFATPEEEKRVAGLSKPELVKVATDNINQEISLILCGAEDLLRAAC